ICLGFYLRGRVPRLRLVNARESIGTAAAFAGARGPVWIVSAGFHTNDAIVDWACRYPLMLTSALESFRLHVAPDLRTFLRARATAAEVRALAAQRGSAFDLGFGAEDDALLGDGWAGAETSDGASSRWIVGSEATVLLPSPRAEDAVLTFEAEPLAGAALPPQRVRLLLDGEELGATAMPPGWQTYAFRIPAARWQVGMHVVAFVPAWSATPASVDRRSTDTRALSLRLTRLTVGARATAPLREPFTLQLDVGGRFLDEETAWRRVPVAAAPRRSHEASPELLARLGIDPETARERLRAGAVALDDLGSGFADRTACLADADFLRLAYAAMLGRRFDPAGDAVELDASANGQARQRIVRDLLRAR
ncbi:MAG TPA: hypothetical protein VN605_04195, partial [Thermoanaerobaculia bacterium]|nr:hypothetical protein [Thermoanaerobaculia bacterium]